MKNIEAVGLTDTSVRGLYDATAVPALAYMSEGCLVFSCFVSSHIELSCVVSWCLVWCGLVLSCLVLSCLVLICSCGVFDLVVCLWFCSCVGFVVVLSYLPYLRYCFVVSCLGSSCRVLSCVVLCCAVLC